MLKNGKNWEIIFIFPFKNQAEKSRPDQKIAMDRDGWPQG